MAGLTYGLAILQVSGLGISLWMTLAFPVWVLIVRVHFLVVRPESPTAGDGGRVDP